MSRIFLSPLIVDIRGKQSDTVFSKWKGINYIRSRVVPANPNTAQQQGIRNALKRLVGLWQDLGATVPINWNFAMSGRDKSGFNHWIGKNTVDERDGNLLEVALDNGYDKITSWSAATGGGSGQIDMTFAPTPVPAGKALAYALRKANTDAWDVKGQWAATTTSPQTISGLDTGQTYQVYGWLEKVGATSGDEVGQSSSDSAAAS